MADDAPDVMALRALTRQTDLTPAHGAWFRLVGTGMTFGGGLGLLASLLSWSNSHTHARLPSHFFVTVHDSEMSFFDVRYPGTRKEEVVPLVELPLASVAVRAFRPPWELSLTTADGRAIAMRADHETALAREVIAAIRDEATQVPATAPDQLGYGATSDGKRWPFRTIRQTITVVVGIVLVTWGLLLGLQRATERTAEGLRRCGPDLVQPFADDGCDRYDEGRTVQSLIGVGLVVTFALSVAMGSKPPS